MLPNGRTRRPWVVVSTLALAISSTISMGAAVSAKADEDGIKKGTFIPTGVHITPSAAPGSSFQALNPGLSFDPSFTVGQAVTTAISPDGKTLLILTSGYNSQNFTSGRILETAISRSPTNTSLSLIFQAGSLSKHRSFKCLTLSMGWPSVRPGRNFMRVADRTTTCTSTTGMGAAGPRAVLL